MSSEGVCGVCSCLTLGTLCASCAVKRAWRPVGSKTDNGKERFDLLPTKAVRAVVRVLGFGATKYGDDNWRHVEDARRRYYAAALRHLTAWWDGEENDPESGLPHLAHAACCVVFLLEGGA